MTRIATFDEQDRVSTLGVELVGQVVAFMEAEAARFGVSYDDTSRSRELGRWVALAVMAAGNDLDWLDRLQFTVGLGHAIGELAGQNPGVAAGLFHAVGHGIEAGQALVSQAFATRGSA